MQFRRRSILFSVCARWRPRIRLSGSSERGNLLVGELDLGDYDEVYVAVFVESFDGERALEIGANKVFGKYASYAIDELAEDGIELGIRGGRRHGFAAEWVSKLAGE